MQIVSQGVMCTSQRNKNNKTHTYIYFKIKTASSQTKKTLKVETIVFWQTSMLLFCTTLCRYILCEQYDAFQCFFGVYKWNNKGRYYFTKKM